METFNVSLVGVGGQGIVLTSKLIAATGARETTIFGMVTEVRPLG